MGKVGRCRKEVRTEVQPSEWLPCVLAVAVAGGTVVQGAGKWQGIFHREGGQIW